MLMVILLALFGIVALRQGEFKITSQRKVDGETSRFLGILLLIAAGLSLLPNSILGFLIFIAVIVIGLVKSKPIMTQP